MISDNSMRDWPQTLRVNAVSVDLAAALWNAQRLTFAPYVSTEFSALPVSKRQEYILAAANILRSLKEPDGLATLARQSMRVVR